MHYSIKPHQSLNGGHGAPPSSGSCVEEGEGGQGREWQRDRGGVDEGRMHKGCHGIRPSQSSEASVQRSAGALKLKPLPEHNSCHGLQEVAVSSQAGYWPL